MSLRPLVRSRTIEVGEYTYYDDPDDPAAFESKAVLCAFGPERLVIGRYCAIAAGVQFLMPGANHAAHGPSTHPFGVFGPPWDHTMDLVMSAPSRGDTVVGHDYPALVMPGIVVTQHARTILSGTPAELERIADQQHLAAP